MLLYSLTSFVNAYTVQLPQKSRHKIFPLHQKVPECLFAINPSHPRHHANIA